MILLKFPFSMRRPAFRFEITALTGRQWKANWTSFVVVDVVVVGVTNKTCDFTRKWPQ